MESQREINREKEVHVYKNAEAEVIRQRHGEKGKDKPSHMEGYRRLETTEQQNRQAQTSMKQTARQTREKREQEKERGK